MDKEIADLIKKYDECKGDPAEHLAEKVLQCLRDAALADMDAKNIDDQPAGNDAWLCAAAVCLKIYAQGNSKTPRQVARNFVCLGAQARRLMNIEVRVSASNPNDVDFRTRVERIKAARK